MALKMAILMISLQETDGIKTNGEEKEVSEKHLLDDVHCSW